MTVYSRLVQRKQLALPIEYVGWRPTNQPPAKKSAELEISGLLAWNLGLALISIALTLAFVFLANYLVSKKYSLEVFRQRLDGANVELELESAAVEAEYSIESLLASAKNLGLVEAKEADFLQRPESPALSQGGN